MTMKMSPNMTKSHQTFQVKKRLETNLKHRKSSRLSVFDNLRNLAKCESPVPAPKVLSKVEQRRQQLEKWKAEKEKQKKEAALQKKKPFVAGVPHNPLKFVPPPPPPKPSTSGRVTRSQSAKNTNKIPEPKDTKPSKSASQSFAPHNASFRPPEFKTLNKLPKLAPLKTRKDKKQNITFDPVLPDSHDVKQTRAKKDKQTVLETKNVIQRNERPTRTKATKQNLAQKGSLKSSSSSEMEPITEVSPILISKASRKSLPAPSSPVVTTKTPRKSFQRTPYKPVPKSESSSEERLRSPKSPASVEDLNMTPQQIAEEAQNISPCVTMSRGKDNARKEMKKKLDEGLLDEDASNIESVDHFRRQLASEIKRMTEMCETWDKILEATVLPESVQEAVLSAVGQARLLMSQKLAQFAALVERCARPEPGAALVTPADLHGFWDMVFMQVENVDMRFKKLEELRLCGWVEEKPVEIKKKVVKANVKKVAKAPGGPSRLKEMIAAARKAKKEQAEQPAIVEPAADAQTREGETSKTFEAGFFRVLSPVRGRSPARTPARTALLKAVLSSEAKKASASKSSASFAMLRASVLGKNVDYDGIDLLPQTPVPMTPINLYATPGRSILKATNTEKKSSRKSIKMVLFNRSDADVQDVSYQTPEKPGESAAAEANTDSGISSMSVEKLDDKENSRRKSKLIRQDAEDRSPVVTRSRRKSMNTSVDEHQQAATPRRSSRKKVLRESEDNVVQDKTKRSTRRRKSAVEAQD
ncbi:unnamed protein product [Chrysodeixis includens]|uniref:Disks large-associated protein 5 n=1 Tax=Chrysodeixis includens TaxID=689277 RepID=A0A9P0BN88_CHRIL|nr:unnamed protein product [Chrysodeixis includens]